MRATAILVAAGLLSITTTAAHAETCSERAALCMGACTPQLVASGEQYGGTVAGCQTSCRSRRASCLKSGVWVHMGSARRGERQAVDKR